VSSGRRTAAVAWPGIPVRLGGLGEGHRRRHRLEGRRLVRPPDGRRRLDRYLLGVPDLGAGHLARHRLGQAGLGGLVLVGPVLVGTVLVRTGLVGPVPVGERLVGGRLGLSPGRPGRHVRDGVLIPKGRNGILFIDDGEGRVGLIVVGPVERLVSIGNETLRPELCGV